MDKIILGLLLIRPMTSYELRVHIKNKFTMMCSDSAGSIQIAIRKLLTENLIVFIEYVENGKNKKQYKITDKGQQVFSTWVEEPMNHRKAKNIELTKLFFMGTVERAKRVQLLKTYLVSLKVDWKALKAMQTEALASLDAATNSEFTDSIQYQMITLDYGISLFEFEIKWYEELIKKMEEGEHNEP